MAFSLALPSLASALRQFYPMKIYESGNALNMLPCDIIDMQVSENYDTPMSPVDSGGFIGDTIYKTPIQISMSVFVSALEYEVFNEKLIAYNYGDGFDINGVDSQTYKNFRLTDKGEPQTADVSGAYIMSLSFREVIIVEAFSSAIPVAKKKSAGYGSKTNKGEGGTQPKRSALKSATKALGF